MELHRSIADAELASSFEITYVQTMLAANIPTPDWNEVIFKRTRSSMLCHVQDMQVLWGI
jgi:hypothetical protein